MASLQRLKSALFSTGTPSISAISVTGRGVARSRTTSKGASSWSVARHSRTRDSMRGSSAAMRRGVNPRFTMRRSPAWVSPSVAMRLRAFMKASGRPRVASAKRNSDFSVCHSNKGGDSLPPIIKTVNMARDEKVSGSFRTC